METCWFGDCACFLGRAVYLKRWQVLCVGTRFLKCRGGSRSLSLVEEGLHSHQVGKKLAAFLWFWNVESTCRLAALVGVWERDPQDLLGEGGRGLEWRCLVKPFPRFRAGLSLGLLL